MDNLLAANDPPANVTTGRGRGTPKRARHQSTGGGELQRSGSKSRGLSLSLRKSNNDLASCNELLNVMKADVPTPESHRREPMQLNTPVSAR